MSQSGLRRKIEGGGAVIRISNMGSPTRARAMVSRCLWPPEKFFPSCITSESSPSGLSLTNPACAMESARQISSSEASFSASAYFPGSSRETGQRCGTSPMISRSWAKDSPGQDAVEQNFPVGYVVKTAEKMNERRFSCACPADNSDCLPFWMEKDIASRALSSAPA